MREAVEYAVGIFHGSIMAIQSGKGEERGRNLSFRRESDEIYPKESPGERAARHSLECALHLF